jgi:two-component system sensor histidine kinase ChiS
MDNKSFQGTLLIVDDIMANISVLSSFLQEYGFRVLITQNGERAIQKAEYAKPDLILMDVMMPVMDGFNACKILKSKENTQDIPIIFMTALADIVDKVKGFDLGAADYITKPFQHEEVLARVNAHIRLRRLQQQVEELQKERLYQLNKAYERFVPHEFLSLLNRSIVDVQLGDQVEKEMTILFSDIRGFTSLSEKMTPQETFNFINSYLNQMAPIIDQHHGFIDKYIGDAIMALFPTHADDAVEAAIAMIEKLDEYNDGRKKAGYLPIQIGIGLNTGKLMLGTVGDKDRMDGTVVSDAVNLASRIEEMTKNYDASLLISESTYSALTHSDRYSVRTRDRVEVKGKSEPVTVYEISKK